MSQPPRNRDERRAKGVHAAGPSVFLAWLDGGDTRGAFTASLMGMMVQNQFAKEAIGQRGGYVRLESTPRLSQARTVAVDTMLATGADWLWCADSDMRFAPDTLQRLMQVASAEHRPIVGGLCFAGARDGCEPYPTMFVLRAEEEGGPAVPGIVWDWPRGRVVDVDATGAAMLLIHRKVLERMAERFPRPYPWFAETFLGEHQIGEDTTFCLRARQLGFTVSVHTGVEIGHVNLHTVGLTDYERISLPKHRVRSGPAQRDAAGEGEGPTRTRAEQARDQAAAADGDRLSVPLRA